MSNYSREVRLNLRLSGKEYAAIVAAAKLRRKRPGTYARQTLVEAAKELNLGKGLFVGRTGS